jgi:ferredoxin
MAYTVTVDREACEGIFACLVRDDRFHEDDDGLASLDVDGDVERTAERVTATLDEDRDAAEQAAAACPVGAIAVTDADTEATEGDAPEAKR